MVFQAYSEPVHDKDTFSNSGVRHKSIILATFRRFRPEKAGKKEETIL